MKTISLSFLLLFFSFSLIAQSTGRIDYKYLGISFDTPKGWMGQETEDGYIFTSNTIAGIIIMIPHDEKHSLDEVEAYAKNGIDEGQGNQLSPKSSLEKFGSDAIGGEFSGTIDWTKVNAYVIGKLNPYGKGVTIISTTSPEQYNANYKAYALELANSIQYAQAQVSALTTKFSNELNGTKLKYLNTYGDASNGGSTTTIIDLCTNGRFSYYHSSSSSASSQDEYIQNGSVVEDTYSGFAGSNNDKSGQWTITSDAAGNPVLTLTDENGAELIYDLSKNSKGELYLNQTRFFRAGGAACN